MRQGRQLRLFGRAQFDAGWRVRLGTIGKPVEQRVEQRQILAAVLNDLGSGVEDGQVIAFHLPQPFLLLEAVRNQVLDGEGAERARLRTRIGESFARHGVGYGGALRELALVHAAAAIRRQRVFRIMGAFVGASNAAQAGFHGSAFGFGFPPEQIFSDISKAFEHATGVALPLGRDLAGDLLQALTIRPFARSRPVSGRTRRHTVPPWLAHSHARIRLGEVAVRCDGRGALRLPSSSIMIKTPEHRFGSGRQFHTGDRVRQVRKADRHWHVEILRAIRLNRDDQRQVQPGGQGLRQPVRRHRSEADSSSADAIFAKEPVRWHADGNAGQKRVGGDRGGWESDDRGPRGADLLQCVRWNDRQEDLTGSTRQVVGLAWNCLPRFANERVVSTAGPMAPFCRPAVHMHKEPPARRRIEEKRACRIRHGPQSLLGAVHRNCYTLDWPICSTGCWRRIVDMSGDTGV